MSKVFDFQFCTDNFDQEMLDFIVEKGWSLEGSNHGSYATVDDNCLYYGTGIDGFWTDADVQHYGFVLLTKQEFKEKIGMVTKQFTKADLRDGMICTSRNGDVFTVQGDRIINIEGRFVLLINISDDLATVWCDDLDIMKVEQPTVLFTRVEVPVKSSAQVELDKLHEQIAALQGQVGDLQEQADKLQKVIE